MRPSRLFVLIIALGGLVPAHEATAAERTAAPRKGPFRFKGTPQESHWARTVRSTRKMIVAVQQTTAAIEPYIEPRHQRLLRREFSKRARQVYRGNGLPRLTARIEEIRLRNSFQRHLSRALQHADAADLALLNRVLAAPDRTMEFGWQQGTPIENEYIRPLYLQGTVDGEPTRVTVNASAQWICAGWPFRGQIPE